MLLKIIYSKFKEFDENIKYYKPKDYLPTIGFIMIENLENDLRQCDNELHKDCIDRINGVISSTDRRFDYVINDINKLDKTVNPNKDLLKK